VLFNTTEVIKSQYLQKIIIAYLDSAKLSHIEYKISSDYLSAGNYLMQHGTFKVFIICSLIFACVPII